MTTYRQARTAVGAAAIAVAAAMLGGCGVVSMAGLTEPIGNFGGPCEPVEGFGGGTEDVAALGDSLYVSADPRRPTLRKGEPIFGRGGLWRVRIGADGKAIATEVTGGIPERFHPHGLSIGAPWGDRIVVGSIFDHRILLCRRDA